MLSLPVLTIIFLTESVHVTIHLIFSGRFDFHVQLAAPATSERGAILKHEIQKRLLDCSEDILLDLAAKCEGYDAYDLVL